MDSKKLLSDIRKELKKHIDIPYRDSGDRFFKKDQKIISLGVRTPMVRKISRIFYTQVTDLPKKQLFDICETLLEKKTSEETTIAFAWVQKRYDELKNTDFPRFERWLKTYVTNWAYCDDFCTHALGHLIWKYPTLVPKTKKWRVSKNRWLRRASAVVFVHHVWSNMKTTKMPYLTDVFEAAETLLHDEDDLVQKGYGWMLKAAADRYPGDVYQFVLTHKHHMPRTALRYAIEKFPREMKKVAMKK